MARTQRARSARAISNDVAIRAAGIAEVLRVGVDHLSLRDVGHRAGLTHGATYARYEDVDELLVDLWNSTMLNRAVALYERCAAVVADPGPESIAALRDWMDHVEPADVACFQVLFTARRLPTLHEEVEPFISEYLIGRWARADVDPAVSTRIAALFSITLVMVTAHLRFGPEPEVADVFVATVGEAMRTAPTAVAAPPAFAAPVGDTVPATEDLRTQLAVATFGVVGRSGYTRATISRIARRANCSPGAIYKLFASKEDLAIEAMRTMARVRWLTTERDLDALRDGWLTALLLDSVSPVNQVRSLFNLEMSIAGAHNERIRAAIQSRLADLEGLVPLLSGLDDDERKMLRLRVRALSFVVVGVTYLSTLGPAPGEAELHAFAEPLRQALVAGPDGPWRKFADQLRELSRARGD